MSKIEYYCTFSISLAIFILFENFNIFTNNLISLKAAKLLQCVLNGTERTKIKGKVKIECNTQTTW
jgi:hypothetical protein